MARVSTVAGHQVRQYTSPNRSTDAMSEHRGVVLHIAEGGFEGTISWQLNPDQRYADGTKVRTCSTWIVGQNEGQVAQMVDSDEVAWCQRSGSRTWCSIELAGFHTTPTLPTAWQRRACAELFWWSHERYGHPLALAATDLDRGLGHHSMDREPTVEWGHEQCPGIYVITAKPAILAIAQELQGGDMALSQDDINRLLGADAVPWDDKLNITVGSALWAAQARADSAFAQAKHNTAQLAAIAARLGAVPEDLTGRLEAILAAASDDPTTSITLTAAERAALAQDLAGAVIDQTVARLQE